MADKARPIIIKKVKKKAAGHHGGSWKVAYADFVTAMMAFFLLLWLLSMSSSEKRAVLAEYFKNFSLFEKSGTSFLQDTSQIFENPGAETKGSRPNLSPGEGEGEDEGGVSAEALRDHLKKVVEEKLVALKDQVLVDILEGGVRIQLVDTEGSPMFPLGSAEPTDKAKQIVEIIAANIRTLPNPIVVEGHTDAAPFRGGDMSNWELSTQRASSARKELERWGIDPARIARVVGYADKEPLDKANPLAAANRRISIILLYKKGEKPPAIPSTPAPVGRH
ncbi:MAG: flagellar motor protein MotB [Thermodesulfobacteriota bacterium]